MTPPKVFCIGFNKTATTSLERVLIDMGYKMPNQQQTERLVVEEMHRGNYEPLRVLCDEFEAFIKMPFSYEVTYIIVDVMFPGSKFILTVRDSNEWFESLERFMLKRLWKWAGITKLEDFTEATYKDKPFYLHQKNYMYNVARRSAVKVVDHAICYDWSLVYDRAHLIETYKRRNLEIVEYFQERQEQLLIFDFSKETDNTRIVKFLGKPETMIGALPYMNRTK